MLKVTVLCCTGNGTVKDMHYTKVKKCVINDECGLFKLFFEDGAIVLFNRDFVVGIKQEESNESEDET